MESVKTQNKSCTAVFTAEEKQLAEKYQVEPKLVRMIAEIVSEHTEGIRKLLNLRSDNQEQNAETPLSIIEKVGKAFEVQPKPEPEEKVGPNTGIKALDDFLERLSHEATATAFGALRLVCVSDSTGKKMSEYLQKRVALLEDSDRVDDFTIDGQVLADIRWFLGFVRGAEIGNIEC